MTNQDYLLKTIGEIARLLEINPQDITASSGMPNPLLAQQTTLDYFGSATPRQLAWVYVDMFFKPYCPINL